MEISCPLKPSYDQTLPVQWSITTMKLYHQKWKELLFISSGFKKKKIMVLLQCWRTQFKSPLWSAPALSVLFLEALPRSRSSPPSQQLTCMQVALCPQGRVWVSATEVAIENANALKTASQLANCHCGAPLSVMGISRKTEILTLLTLRGVAWSQAACTVLRSGQRALAMVFSALIDPRPPAPAFFLNGS